MIRHVIRMVAIVGSLLVYPVAASAAPAVHENLSVAMHDEALAYGDYQAWAGQADSVNRHDVAVLLGIIATQEREEHFAELAELTDVIGPSLGNLTATIGDENAEATRIYPEFRDQARADGDLVTADLFAELATDEATHRVVAVKARHALCDHGPHPVAPKPDPVAIVQQPAQTSGKTLTNVRTAMRGEAYASARYRLFAQRAYADGLPWLGKLFATLADVELTEHYAALANRYGLVGSIGANVTAAIMAEKGAVSTYANFALVANRQGDIKAGKRFEEIGTDEAAHLALFARTRQ